MSRPILLATLSLLCIVRAGPALAGFAPLEKSSDKQDGAAPPASTAKILDCSGAIPLMIDSTARSSTVGLPDQISGYGCSTWPETGGEAIYSLSVSAPAMFEIRLSASCDLDLILLDACDVESGCLLVADTGIQTTNPVTGEFFIIVDGYDGAACDFQLDVVAVYPGNIDPLACESATNLGCTQSTAISGNNCGASSYVHSLGCESWPAGGGDVWYRLTVEPAGSFEVDLSMPDADAVLWILEGCGVSPACLDHSDSGLTGEGEQVSYTNETGQNQTVFLVVDSYGAASCSDYDGVINCDGVIVATQSSSWSSVKARYNRGEK